MATKKSPSKSKRDEKRKTAQSIRCANGCGRVVAAKGKICAVCVARAANNNR